jgi:predicted secreted protein
MLCAGEDLLPPSSSNADEGYQWELQTDEGWVPYWDSQA